MNFSIIQPDSTIAAQIYLREFAQNHAVNPLEAHEIHLWLAPLIRSEGEQQALLGSLSSDELARASRFHFERDRRRFVAARGILRHLLGGYLTVSPSTIRFSYSSSGKPSLATPLPPPLYFNVSHSADLALFAVTANQPIGVDIESIREEIDTDLLAPAVFTPLELEQWQALPREEQRSAFFSLWTRKEALVKAWGDGIVYPLHELNVGFSPHPPTQIQLAVSVTKAANDWSIWDIPVTGNFRAAIAT